MEQKCPLCQRVMPVELIQRHHLRTKKTDKTDWVEICRECHKTIHGFFSNSSLRDLQNDLASIEGLLKNPKMNKALGFIKRMAPGRKLKTWHSKLR